MAKKNTNKTKVKVANNIYCKCGAIVGEQTLTKYDNTYNSIDSGGDAYTRNFNDNAYRDNFDNVLRIKGTDYYWCKNCKK